MKTNNPDLIERAISQTQELISSLHLICSENPEVNRDWALWDVDDLLYMVKEDLENMLVDNNIYNINDIDYKLERLNLTLKS
jgi:hypothetical protein